MTTMYITHNSDDADLILCADCCPDDTDAIKWDGVELEIGQALSCRDCGAQFGDGTDYIDHAGERTGGEIHITETMQVLLKKIKKLQPEYDRLLNMPADFPSNFQTNSGLIENGLALTVMTLESNIAALTPPTPLQAAETQTKRAPA